MAINFPSTTGQATDGSFTHTDSTAGITWTWDGTSWSAGGVGGSGGIGTDGSVNTTGIITASAFYGDGSNLTGINSGIGTDGSVNTTGIITASAFYGDGSNLTGVSGGGGGSDGSDLRSVTGTTLVTYASASDISHGARSIVGFSTYSQVGILTQGEDILGADDFGRVVAMSADGKTLFIGAPRDAIDGAPSRSGGLYIFERVGAGTSFNQLGILTGSGLSNSYFGDGVACSADGKTVVVTAPYDDVNDTGLAYVFDRIGDTYSRVGILSNSIQDSVYYSGPYVSVDISADGKTIILSNEGVAGAGATDDTGAVFLWKRDGDTFTEVGIVTNTRNTAGSEWGESIAISGDGKTIVVGALSDYSGSDYHGSVSIFDVVGVGTNLSFNNVGILTGSFYSGEIGDTFGCSVDISYDGRSIIVGDFSAEIDTQTTNTGLAYVYDRDGNNFNLVSTLIGSRSKTNGAFGQTVVMSADGNRMLISGQTESVFDNPSGNYPEGIIYTFERQGNTINQVGLLTAYDPNYPPELTGNPAFNMGSPWDKHLAMSADGKTIVVGYQDALIAGTRSGAAIVYDAVDTTVLSVEPSGNVIVNAGFSVSGLLKESVNVTAGTLSANPNIDVENGMVHLFTTAETTTSTPNIRYNATTSLDSAMSTGEAVSVTLITTAAAAGYATTITIDGANSGLNWTSGAAPVDGGTSGVDLYAFTIIKTGSAAFTVIGSQTKTS